MTEPKIFSRSEALQMVRKSAIDAINRFTDPTSEANILCQQKLKELGEKEIEKQVAKRLEPEREAVRSELDRLQANHDELLNVLKTSKAGYDAIMLKITAIEQREENYEKLYDTMTKLIATLTYMVNLLEKKTGIKKTGGV